MNHATGFRFVPAKNIALETAYLSHRVDKTWVDDFELDPGGVKDFGGEISVWFSQSWLRRLKTEIGLIGRLFDVYRENQSVLGMNGRISILAASGHAATMELKVLRVFRSDPRVGVDQVTWNTIGSLYWQSMLTDFFGIKAGGLLSANLLVGEVPMLELRRSMIGEPMALAELGLIFII